jgi:hypothetical protein
MKESKKSTRGSKNHQNTASNSETITKKQKYNKKAGKKDRKKQERHQIQEGWAVVVVS